MPTFSPRAAHAFSSGTPTTDCYADVVANQSVENLGESEMKKLIFLISLIAILTSTGCQTMPAQTAQNTKPNAYAVGPENQAIIDAIQFPEGTDLPAKLPTTIHDPILLKGWVLLYNRTKTCNLWEDHAITGRQLAEYVIDHQVVISWNTDPAYSDRSWVDRGGTDTIYIHTGYQEDSETKWIALVNTMAHELFHRTSPFDQEQDTLYEEYYAFYVGSCVSGWAEADFDHFNPLSPTSLQNWFKYNNRAEYYVGYPLYPEEIVSKSTLGNQ
jgi:hypothetical protein